METNRVAVSNPDLLRAPPASAQPPRAPPNPLPNPQFGSNGGVITDIPMSATTVDGKLAQRLYVGITYRAKAGESLASIAQRFRTTVKGILSLNFDLQGDQIQAGQDLCLIPCDRTTQ
mmetsp:Transcript_49784/g.130980  ORF Transcript_49784/g.130980 Transcript_49784/m.130980 type:complete len:118 (+) Transcript_49784:394-747(+)